VSGVDGAHEDQETDNRDTLDRLTPDEADQLLAGIVLGMGSIKPKIEAGVNFVRGGVERAIIADLASGLEAIRGENGTTITGEN
jgi:carbamate kinase